MLFKKQESYRKGVVASTVLNIISKGVSFLNSVLLVYLFGTNFGTDTYFLVISTVSFIASFLLGIISYVVIPEAMRIRHNVDEKTGQGYINFFFWLFLLIGLAVALIVWICGPFFYSLFSKYTTPDLGQYKALILLSAVLFPLNFMTNLLVFVMSSYKYFTIPMVVSLINSCTSIVLLFVLKNRYGITAGMIAFVAGFLINLIWLLYYLRKELKWDFFYIYKPSRKNWGNIFLMELNIIPVSFRSFVNIYMLSGLGAGIVTAYNYGMQIALIPEMMIISQVSAVAGIKFNELSASGETEQIGKLFSRVMKLLCLGLVPIAAIIFLLSTEILEVLFMFKKEGEIQTFGVMAAFMAAFALTLPARALDSLVSNIMTAQQKIRQGVLMAVFLHSSIILLTILSVHLWGLKGFYYLTGFVYLVYIPVFYFYFARKVLPFLRISVWFRESAKFVLLMTLVIIGLFFLKQEYLFRFSLTVNISVITLVVLLSVISINRYLKYQAYSFSI